MRRCYGALLATLLLLTACGGGSREPTVENPYESLMQELTSNGVLAMQRERWEAAEHSFVRALQAAQLTADPALIAHAWYNLGIAYMAEGRMKEADQALHQAEGLAKRHQLPAEYERARLNRALLAARQGKPAWKPAAFSRKMPVDIHLAAARLADLQQRNGVAEEEYQLVLSEADGKSAGGLRYRAQAEMGLALLALRQGQRDVARQHGEKALQYCRKVGVPRLAAHALMLQADLAESSAERQDKLERARGIYQALNDRENERKALTALLQMAVKAGNGAAEKQLRQAISNLANKEKR